jgi:hypothetical protein
MKSLSLSPQDRSNALVVYKSSRDPGRRIRAHILLLLDDGLTLQKVGAVTYAGPKEVEGVIARFEKEGIDGVLS